LPHVSTWHARCCQSWVLSCRRAALRNAGPSCSSHGPDLKAAAVERLEPYRIWVGKPVPSTGSWTGAAVAAPTIAFLCSHCQVSGGGRLSQRSAAVRRARLRLVPSGEISCPAPCGIRVPASSWCLPRGPRWRDGVAVADFPGTCPCAVRRRGSSAADNARADLTARKSGRRSRRCQCRRANP
jgi:hypothetical protein